MTRLKTFTRSSHIRYTTIPGLQLNPPSQHHRHSTPRSPVSGSRDCILAGRQQPPVVTIFGRFHIFVDAGHCYAGSQHWIVVHVHHEPCNASVDLWQAQVADDMWQEQAPHDMWLEQAPRDMWLEQAPRDMWQ